MDSFRYLLLPVLNVFLVSSPVRAELVSAIILPHGDLAYDPTFLIPGSSARKAADEISQQSRRAAHWFTNALTGEGIIFLSTPHGIQLTRDFGIYLGRQASGTINITGDNANNSHPPVTVTMPPIDLAGSLGLDLAVELTSNQKEGAFAVEGIATSADGSRPTPLEWAEIIPLTFLPEDKRSSSKYIIWSYPLRRYTESPDMVPELLEVGAAIRTWMEQIPNRIGVLISGDMSHTHEASGPYGYSNTSAPFDSAVGHWATNPCNNSASLLLKARALQDRAMSCGFTGLVLLHGMLCGDDNNDNHRHSPWDPLVNDRVYVNRNATYYGMLVATFGSRKDVRKRSTQTWL